MPDCNAAFTVRRYAVTNSGWTAVIAPIECNTFTLREASGKAFNMASDESNSEAWDQIAAGNTFGLLNAVASLPGTLFPKGTRFPMGSTLLWVQAIDDTGATVVCYCGI